MAESGVIQQPLYYMDNNNEPVLYLANDLSASTKALYAVELGQDGRNYLVLVYNPNDGSENETLLEESAQDNVVPQPLPLIPIWTGKKIKPSLTSIRQPPLCSWVTIVTNEKIKILIVEIIMTFLIGLLKLWWARMCDNITSKTFIWKELGRIREEKPGVISCQKACSMREAGHQRRHHS